MSHNGAAAEADAVAAAAGGGRADATGCGSVYFEHRDLHYVG